MKREKLENIKIKMFCNIINNKYEKNILKTIFLNGSTFYEFENPTYYPIQLTSINRIDIKLLIRKNEFLCHISKFRRLSWEQTK